MLPRGNPSEYDQEAIGSTCVEHRKEAPEVAKPSSCSFLDGSFGTGHPAAPGGCVMASDCLQLLGSW